MAFLKFAKAQITTPAIDIADWFNITKKQSNVKVNVKTASSNVIKEYSPKDYLLTHCTIIASVDTESPKNVKIGSFEVDGCKVNCLYPDFLITPKTAMYVNGNGDAWERKLLLATYRTFVGSFNYLEHCQDPKKSKGKIIDAVARDLGDTVYVDILVATSRKHGSLIKDILDGTMKAMSMGCVVTASTCTKCGNVAEDDTQLCHHVRYEKGQFYRDAKGTDRVVAELCGHVSDPESVKFIEASWVADPAFTGAVLHRILNPDILDQERVATLLKQAFTAESKISIGAIAKAASMRKQADDYDEKEFLDAIDMGDDEDLEDTDTTKKEDEDKDKDKNNDDEIDEDDGLGEEAEDEEMSFEDYSDDPGVQYGVGMADDGKPTSYDELVDNMTKRLIGDIWTKVLDSSTADGSENFNQLQVNQNDNFTASRVAANVRVGAKLYRTSGLSSIKGKYNGLEMLFIARKAGIPYTKKEIHALLKVGSLAKYGNKVSPFLANCQLFFDKQLSKREAKKLIFGGYLLNMRKSKA